MTKTLTEQWREGTLPDGYYYVVSKWSGKIEINDYYEGCWQDLKEEYIKEVLAPVPSYDEYKRLQEQLNEANEVIMYYDIKEPKYVEDGVVVAKDPAHRYLEKWGVK